MFVFTTNLDDEGIRFFLFYKKEEIRFGPKSFLSDIYLSLREIKLPF